MSEPVPLFTGEAMLLSWGDTSSRGKTVMFQLHEDDCGQNHPFRDLGTGRHGQRFRLIAQPIGDDDQPLGVTEGSPVAPRDKAGDPAPGERTYTLANKIGMLCNDASFQRWIAIFATKLQWDIPEGKPQDVAALLVRKWCGVKTRADIVPGSKAAWKWNEIVLQFEADTNRMAEERHG